MGRSGRGRSGGPVVAALLFFAACTSGGGRVASTPAPGAVVVGSFDFPESEVLAEVYGQALAASGIPVRVDPGLGPRELVEPALQRGLLQLVPEYQGSALQFLAGPTHPSGDASATHASLVRALDGTPVTALSSAPGQDANAFAVSRATAERYGLRSISDLLPVASKLILGGPPECPQRPLCLIGLRTAYGLRFRDFVPLDTGGPLTVAALAGGDVDVALVFTTDPSVVERGFRLLTDDRGLEPSENVTPVISRTLLRRYGDRVREPVDRVSALLTTSELVGLNRALAAGRPAAAVAAAWLSSNGMG